MRRRAPINAGMPPRPAVKRAPLRKAVAFLGIAANLVGVAALAFDGSRYTVVGDTTTTMVWLGGGEPDGWRWAWPAVAVTGLLAAVLALRGRRRGGVEG